MPEPSYVLVVRVWSEPDGRYVVRLAGQTEPGAEPSFVRAVAPGDAPSVVGEWLALVTAR
jgi:hypothetical protein